MKPDELKVRNPHDVLRNRTVLDPVYGCWVWQGAKDRNGYGQLRFNYGHFKAHRFAYTLLVGPIPADIDVHHICENKACCNPDHLMLVSKRDHGRMQNGQREKTHCVNGHEFTPLNTYRFKGKRLCKRCRSIWSAEQRAKRKGVIGS